MNILIIEARHHTDVAEDLADGATARLGYIQ
jgi:hypothetical protein